MCVCVCVCVCTVAYITYNYNMKSTKVQTLGTLHATTDCTDDASIVGFNWAIV